MTQSDDMQMVADLWAALSALNLALETAAKKGLDINIRQDPCDTPSRAHWSTFRLIWAKRKTNYWPLPDDGAATDASVPS